MFYLNGIPLCIRQLEEIDLKNSFYELMELSSNETIELINTSTSTELFYKLYTNYKIFVIIDLNTNLVIGTGNIKISNKKTLFSVCTIQDIKIHDGLNNNIYVNEHKDNLYTIFLQSLIDYCREQEQCSKYIVKIDNKSEEHFLHRF